MKFYTANELYLYFVSILRQLSSPRLMAFLHIHLLKAMHGLNQNNLERIYVMRQVIRQGILSSENLRDTDTQKLQQALTMSQSQFSEKELENMVDTRDENRKLRMPPPHPIIGLTLTQNNMGLEFPYMPDDIFSAEFERTITGHEKKHMLILGAGYGTYAVNLLEKTQHNESQFVINDLSSDHMAIFANNLPTHLHHRVTIISGNFLTQVDFPINFFDAILVQQTIHFFTPEEINIFFQRTHRWLKSSGQLIVTCQTPFSPFLSCSQPIQLFQERKRQGNYWPGFLTNLKQFLEEQGESALAATSRTSHFHYLDPDILQREMHTHGFQAIRTGFFGKRPPFITSSEGQEFAGAVGYKAI